MPGEKLGHDYCVLNTTALQGSCLEFASGQVLHPVSPACPRSLEAALAQNPAEFIFLDASRPMRADLVGLPSRSMEFGCGLPAGGAEGSGRYWDGVFYIRELRPVTMERSSAQATSSLCTSSGVVAASYFFINRAR